MSIYTNIIGGLGNQLFQYSAGKSLSIKTGLPLKLVTDMFGGYKLHNGLEICRIFNIFDELASNDNIEKHLGFFSNRKLRYFLFRKNISKFLPEKIFVEEYFEFNDRFAGLKDSCYLHGYWQSPRYFKENWDEISKSLTFRIPLDDINDKITEEMAILNSVSVHIRRGDYLKSKNSKIFAFCNEDYYKKSINFFVENFKNCKFYFFSDDPSWVAENFLNIGAPSEIISHNFGENSYKDMQLMSHCKHNIIANSTFSWWAAWLNKNPTKIVISPEKWFHNSNSIVDLIPSNWMKMKNV